MKSEVGGIDGPHPLGVGINHQGADRERDAVGNSGLPGVEAQQPGLAGKRENCGWAGVPVAGSLSARAARQAFG